jgi:hypothetical protein
MKIFPFLLFFEKKIIIIMRKLYMVELVCISILAMYQLKIKKQLKIKRWYKTNFENLKNCIGD